MTWFVVHIMKQLNFNISINISVGNELSQWFCFWFLSAATFRFNDALLKMVWMTTVQTVC